MKNEIEKITCEKLIMSFTLDDSWSDEHHRGYTRATSVSELTDSPLLTTDNFGETWIDEDGVEFELADPENMNVRYPAHIR